MSDADVKAEIQRIAELLGETEAIPLSQLDKIVEHCGMDFMQAVYEETVQIEAQGGLMLSDNSRRRTVGGVFFYLARRKMPKDKRLLIFSAKRKETSGHKKHAAPAIPQYPLFVWEDRLPILRALLETKGELQTVKVTLIGRPGKVEMRKDLVITTMTHTVRSATLPKGIPTPPETPTVYTVYISAKQWRRVESALENAEDVLIIEGISAFDADLQAIAVYANNVTSKMIEIGKRDKKQEASPKETVIVSTSAPQPVFHEPVETAPSSGAAFPSNMPADVRDKLSGLYASASLFRQKIAGILAKPTDQQTGLEMTQKLLKNAEDQIAAIEQQYKE